MWKRKRTLKEEYGTLGHFLRGDNDCHYLGDLYIEGTNFYRHREWRGVRDTAYAFARWLQTWVKMAGLIGRDPEAEENITKEHPNGKANQDCPSR